jgi:small-conductance mechanosensitive channel
MQHRRRGQNQLLYTSSTNQKLNTSKGTAKRNNMQRRRVRRRGRRAGSVQGARSSLRQFRQATIVAVAITGLLFLVFFPSEGTQQPADTIPVPENYPDTVAIIENIALDELIEQRTQLGEEELSEPLGKAAAEEAVTTARNLWRGFYSNLPKIAVALAALFLSWLLTRLLRPVLLFIFGHWERSNALVTITNLCIWLIAFGVALSVLAGDIRALVGSLGLVGLALSWALQVPIESFTGWLLNSFQGYYKVGDRILVGEVFGDVYKIDFLTTTVWEIGGPHRQGFVNAEQPTGRLVTFPNNEVLTGSIVNLTRDFPYVWDEINVQVANESDLPFTQKLLGDIAQKVIGNSMKPPALAYEQILNEANLEHNIPTHPQIFFAMDESWTNITIRYLIKARERRMWVSQLTLNILQEMNKPENKEKIIPVYPRQQIQFIHPDGHPLKPSWII